MHRKLYFLITLAFFALSLGSCKKDATTPDSVNSDTVAIEQVDGNTASQIVSDRSGCLYRLNLYSGKIDVYGFGGAVTPHVKYCGSTAYTVWDLKTFYIPGNTPVVLSTPASNTTNRVRFIGKANGTYFCLTPVDGAGNQIGTTICVNLNNTSTYDLLVNQANCGITIANCTNG